MPPIAKELMWGLAAFTVVVFAFPPVSAVSAAAAGS
jgi:hypothetical protein